MRANFIGRDKLGRITSTTPAAERFWFLVRKLKGRNACWEWRGGMTPKGYGVFWDGSRQVSAHRFSATLHFNGIPAGFHVLHHCDNRRCVRPDHLFVGTPKINSLDMMRKGRWRHGRIVPMRGEKNGNSRLTDAAARVIAQRLKDGATQTSLAREFAVSNATIWRIAHGRRRAAIESEAAA
jgi:hypothetical protein